MNNNDNNKTEPSKQGQANVQPIRDEHGKQASAPSKTQGDTDTTKLDASGKDGSKSAPDNSAK